MIKKLAGHSMHAIMSEVRSSTQDEGSCSDALRAATYARTVILWSAARAGGACGQLPCGVHGGVSHSGVTSVSGVPSGSGSGHIQYDSSTSSPSCMNSKANTCKEIWLSLYRNAHLTNPTGTIGWVSEHTHLGVWLPEFAAIQRNDGAIGCRP